ncbi:hypothetical protein EVG20_g2369 [Dentipellis fragilis]|uniref:F-box domain-containing protein n=1 Tax=Dentipellis fragilis TaxID=205917 RepID=A0A4Y9Z9E1_9AGAM|nr:hypothetical protein EVG20_g2369 [Dentipellis fragilis]
MLMPASRRERKAGAILGRMLAAGERDTHTTPVMIICIDALRILLLIAVKLSIECAQDISHELLLFLDREAKERFSTVLNSETNNYETRPSSEFESKALSRHIPRRFIHGTVTLSLYLGFVKSSEIPPTLFTDQTRWFPRRSMLKGPLKSIFRRPKTKPKTAPQTNKTSVAQSSPIFRLPPELLGIIFMHVLDDDEAFVIPKRKSLNHREKTRAPAWTDLLLVCRYWRDVALNFPVLWSRIEPITAEWMEQCLQRSHNVPLRLKMAAGDAITSTGRLSKIFHLADINMSRMQELTITSTPGTVGTFTVPVSLLIRRVAPELEVLTIDQGSIVATGPRTMDSYYYFSKEIFQGNAPKLRRLCVRSNVVQFRMQVAFFRSLTHLEIANHRLWQSEAMEVLIECMGTWTQLRVLVLKGSLPTDTNATNSPSTDLSSPRRRIRPPHLQRLEIADSASSADHFLDHIILPPRVALSLICALGDDTPNTDGPQMQQDALAPLPQPPARLIEPYSAITHAYVIAARCSIAVAGFAGPVVKNKTTVLRLLRFSELVELYIVTPHGFREASWISVLQPMANLRVLRVDGHCTDMDGFLFALSSRGIDSADGMHPMLPHLQKLHLEHRFLPITAWEYLLGALVDRQAFRAPKLDLLVQTSKASIAQTEGHIRRRLQNITSPFELTEMKNKRRGRSMVKRYFSRGIRLDEIRLRFRVQDGLGLGLRVYANLVYNRRRCGCMQNNRLAAGSLTRLHITAKSGTPLPLSTLTNSLVWPSDVHLSFNGVASFKHRSSQMEPVVYIPRSTDSPVYRLPSEILGTIILLLLPRRAGFADDDEMEDEEPDTPELLLSSAHCRRKPWQSQTEAPSWTNVLYVCRRWQSVALNCPDLWTGLYNNNPWWATACVSLSRQMPLELALTQTKANLGDSLAVARIAIRHFYRMRKANIVSSQHDFVASVLGCLERTPAPLLEEFSVECTGCTYIDHNHSSWFPQFLFAQQSTSLRKLKISHYGCLQIPLLSHVFLSLTHLEISDPSFWAFETMDITVRCMEAWKCLEVLVLTCPWSHQMASSRICDRNPYPMAPPNFIIAVPHLKQIRITDCAMLADRFLRHLVLSPSISLSLHCELFTAATLLHPLIVARSLLSHVPPGATRQVASLDVSICDGFIDLGGITKHEVTGFNGRYYDSEDEGEDEGEPDDSLVYRRTSSNYKLGLILGHHDNVVAHPGYLGGVFEQLNFCRTFDFSLYLKHNLPRETWIQVLRPMGRVEDLHLSCTARKPTLKEFIEVLGMPVPGVHTMAPGTSLFLPRLKLLDLHISLFDEVGWQYLADVLVWRYGMGSQLDFLILWECSGDVGRHRPDERTQEVLDKVIDVEIIWKVEMYRKGLSMADEEEETDEDEDDWMSEGEVEILGGLGLT